MFIDDQKETEQAPCFKKSKTNLYFAVVLLLVLLIFLVAGCSWFALDFLGKQRYLNGYEELDCIVSDDECYKNLCPDGMIWNTTTSTCHLLTQSTCCYGQDRVVKCWDSLLGTRNCSMIQVAGVAQSGYKLFCRAGFIWVPWKNSCYRATKHPI